MSVYDQWENFINLFGGLADFTAAHGTGAGSWVKRPLRSEDVVKHLQGDGVGIGLPPLRTDNCVVFAAIDLDEPDFDAARDMQAFLPGQTWLERSRSGNAHVWAFFRDPIEAWIPMGIMREACVAAGKPHVEVFPKNHDHSKIKLGNYINLPYHGKERPILVPQLDGGIMPRPEGLPTPLGEVPLDYFIEHAYRKRNDPDVWRKRVRWLGIAAPEERERSAEFGQSKNLHICAEHVIEHAEDNPVLEGHRAVVYFNLAKALTNWEQVDHDEALDLMKSVNEASPDRISNMELLRILGNAERGGYTSTGCDDPLFAPYAHPNCPIARRA